MIKRSRPIAGAGLFGLCLAPAIAMAMQIAAAPQPPPSAPSSAHPADVDTGVGRFASRLISVHDDLIVRIYAQTLRERFADREGGEAEVRSLLSSPGSIGGSPFYASARIEQGEFAGRWSFESPDGGLPTRAWRDIDRSGAQGYDAERVGYCRGTTSDCAVWFEAKRHRSAQPDALTGERAQREWVQRVIHEPCAPVPPHRPSLAPLQTAVGRAGLPMTRVIVRLLHNRCGEVRQVQIVQSSRHRDIDREVIAWARGLVEAQPEHETRGFYSRVPFDLVAMPATDETPDATAPAPRPAP